MRVAISGAGGLVGSAVGDVLREAGHEVVAMVRRPARSADEIEWHPDRELDPAALAGVDAVVHLAGESIFGLWTTRKRRAIRDSRVLGTATIARALARMEVPVSAFVVASATGFYGAGGDGELREDAPAGEGFLAGVVRDWERAADPARAGGIRTVHLRQGIVLSRSGGALGTALPAFRMGMGGKFGNGRQWMGWISLRDDARAFARAVEDESMSGAYNAVAPQPVHNVDYVRAIGRALRRPTFMTVPAFALRLLLGDLADETLLVSQRVVPTRLAAAGFDWRDADLDDTLTRELTR